MAITEEKDLIWLPKSLVKKIKDIEDTKTIEAEIYKYIEESKKDLRINLESLDDDVLLYKAYMIKAKNAFEAAKNEQLEASYALWEKFDTELYEVRKKVEKVKEVMNPIKQELEELKTLMNSVKTYDIEKLLEVIKTIATYLSYDGDTAKVVRFLFENYKKPV